MCKVCGNPNCDGPVPVSGISLYIPTETGRGIEIRVYNPITGETIFQTPIATTLLDENIDIEYKMRAVQHLQNLIDALELQIANPKNRKLH